MVVQESKLLALPDEILINIIAFLEEVQEDAWGCATTGPRALLEARLTCSDLKALVDPFVFKSYDIVRGEKSERLAVLLARDDRRASWLRSVLISTRYDDDQGLEYFPGYLRAMRNLRRLVLETPDCNSKHPEQRVQWIQLQKQYENILQQSSVAIPPNDRLLPLLEECTVHFVDEAVSLYPLTKYSSIFLHPTLKSLTISCACTDMPSRILHDHRQFKHTTALEHVHFEECDFNADSLEILLQFPRALKSLKMSEGVRYDMTRRHSRLHGDLNPGMLSRALSHSVGSSLETLSLSLGYQRNRGQRINTPGRSLDLTAFSKLRRLEVSMKTLGLLITRPTCDHQTYRRLPPSLETLRIFTIPLLILQGKPPVPFQTCLFKDKTAHGLPNLQQLIYCYEYQGPRRRFSFGLIQHGGENAIGRFINQSKDNVKAINDKNYHMYKRNGLRVTIEVEVTPPAFIPPYLHNEEKPIRSIIWDTTEPTFNALRYEERAKQTARAAACKHNVRLNALDDSLEDDGGGETERSVEALYTNQAVASDGEGDNGGEEDSGEDEEDDEDPLAYLHLAPQGQELFELLVMQP